MSEARDASKAARKLAERLDEAAKLLEQIEAHPARRHADKKGEATKLVAGLRVAIDQSNAHLERIVDQLDDALPNVRLTLSMLEVIQKAPRRVARRGWRGSRGERR